MRADPIRFGTDGWRAIIAQDFTFANVQRVAQATADHFRASLPAGTRHLIIVGFDRRFLSDQFATAAAEVFAAAGFSVVLADSPVPTPAVSFAVPRRRACCGVVITASHNPAAFNGYKLKTHTGGPADRELCRQIEQRMDQNPPRSIPLKLAIRRGQVRRMDLKPAWYTALKSLVDFKGISRSKLRLVHEPLYGVGAGCFDDLLRATSCRVQTLHARHDPTFGGLSPEPIARNYGPTIRHLRAHPADLCIVTDGDADRIGALDGRGKPLSTHQIICLLLRHCIVNRKGRGRVVKALTTTSMVDRMCAAWGLDLTETGVGFKFIAHEMIQGGVLLGAEESGGIGFCGHIQDRDGVLAGLMLLEMLAMERRPLPVLLRRLESQFGPHHYERMDLHCAVERHAGLLERVGARPPDRLGRSAVVAVKSLDGVKFIARDGSWLMLRGSGTEPVLRIYAEAPTPRAVQRLLALGRRLCRG